MTDQTPDAAREADVSPSGATLNAKLSERASGLQVAPIALTIGFPDSDDPAARFREWYNPAHWFWWGRGLGVFIGILVREREAAVSRSRDAEWREEAEKLRRTHPSTECPSCTEMHSCTKGQRVFAHNAALDALIARMDTARAGGANG